MTVSPSRPTIAAPDVEAALAAVRARGRRVSAARRLVIEALFAVGGPVSAADIAGGLDGSQPPLDLASVYSNLEQLEDLGLVSHVHRGHGPGLYALRDRVESEYLECERCGAFRAVRPSVLAATRAAIREATGFEARFSHFPIMGLCPDCAKEPHA